VDRHLLLLCIGYVVCVCLRVVCVCLRVVCVYVMVCVCVCVCLTVPQFPITRFGIIIIIIDVIILDYRQSD